MKNKVKVTGKAQNRLALGIVTAWAKMSPKADLAALRQAFPDSLNPDSGVKANFITEEEYANRGNKEWKGYFTEDNEVLTLGKQRIVVVSMWTKDSFDRLVKKAASYGIEVDKAETFDKGSGPGYELQCLDGYKYPQAGGCLGMMLTLIALGGTGMYMLFS